jgi:hypothetical protein
MKINYGCAALAILPAVFVATHCSSASLSAPKDAKDRVALAERYLMLTHREDYARSVYGKELKLSLNYCHNPRCQADLDKAITDGVTVAVRQYLKDVVDLYAKRLTARQLSAAIQFAESPDGKAILQTESLMTDEVAQIGHSVSLTARNEVFRRFCADQPKLCTAPKSAPAPAAKGA